MDIRAELLKEHSKKQSLKIAAYIADDKKKFSLLMDIFLGSEYRPAQRAAWVVNFAAQKSPQLIYPYMEAVIDNMENSVHDAVRRNTLRLLQFIEIPNYLLGKAASVCFNLLQKPTEPIAVKVFSMTVLFNICKKEPELAEELKLIVKEQLPYGSTGFRNRAGKVLAALEKIHR